jgi:hypothetical protein
MFASPQSITHFTTGPPQHLYATQSGSLASSLQGQPQSTTSVAGMQAWHNSAGLASSGSTGQTTFAGSSVEYPSTPIQQQLPSIHGYENRASQPVKVEDAGIFGQYAPATQKITGQEQSYHVASSSLGGSVQGHSAQRLYHPYRSPQSEPVNRVASSSLSRHFPPPPPPSFAFGQSLARPTSNTSPMSAQPQDMFSVPAADSGTHIPSKHHHTGSLEFAMSATPAAYHSRAPIRPSFTQSMSLPNHAGLAYPASPEGQSVQTESDDFDEDGTGMSRSPQMVTPALGGFGFQHSPKSPKRHVW